MRNYPRKDVKMMMEKLKELFEASNQVVIFTGAGMSTESGLPDFRSKDRGLWEKFNPDELANIQALIDNAEEFTSFYQHRVADIDQHQAHVGPYVLAKYEQEGKISGVITQNVDGFHHDAGSKNVKELHGSFRDLYCHDCKKTYTRDAYLKPTSICECGCTIRPGIVLFGEMLPEVPFNDSVGVAEHADLFIVLGSSLTVSPASIFPLLARERGAKLIIINQDPTPYDKFADLIIQDKSIKEVLEEMDQSLS